MFVLLYKDVLFNLNDLESSLLSVVFSVLQEFEDVFLEDGPSGLPPFKGIEHHIDFYPGATFPTHQLIGLILRRQRSYNVQVEELMAKGHVRESLSP